MRKNLKKINSVFKSSCHLGELNLQKFTINLKIFSFSWTAGKKRTKQADSWISPQSGWEGKFTLKTNCKTLFCARAMLENWLTDWQFQRHLILRTKAEMLSAFRKT